MASLSGSESDPLTPGVHGTHGSSGPGLRGESEIGPGVHGISRGTDPNEKGIGVWGQAIGTAVAGDEQRMGGGLGSHRQHHRRCRRLGAVCRPVAWVSTARARWDRVLWAPRPERIPTRWGSAFSARRSGPPSSVNPTTGSACSRGTQTGEAGVRAGRHVGDGVGVHGSGAGGTGVLATSSSGIGLLASTENGEAAIRGDHHGSGFAGVFNGPAPSHA